MKKSENDIVTSLMANKDFRDWIYNPTEDRNLYWEKWIVAHPEHRDTIYHARNYLQKLKLEKQFLEIEELEEILDNIISNKNSNRIKSSLKSKSSVGWVFKIAASILLILTAIYSYRYVNSHFVNESHPEDIVAIYKAHNPEGQRSKVKLPDGSIVNLNAQSTLIFPKEFSDTIRQVELSGEAFFDVVRDVSKPFIVKTNNLETEVLGTTFNVRAFNDESEINVSLLTGKVIVKNTDDMDNLDEQILLPGEKLTYNKSISTYSKSQFDITEETGWKDDILVFKNTDFEGFVKLLEQWYGVEIDVLHRPDNPWHVNGHFKNESLEEVLMGVQFTYDIEYKIENKSVTLNCK